MSNNISRIFDFGYHQLENFPQKKCFNYKENNSWKSISTQQFITDANKVSSSLLALGIKPNDKIAVITTNNNPNWHILDIGILNELPAEFCDVSLVTTMCIKSVKLAAEYSILSVNFIFFYL